jgi:phosphopantetheine--protein transferase-like protein
VLCVSPVRNRTAEGRTRDPGASELAREFFSAAEARAVEEYSGQANLQSFFQFWSLKEAALKSIGEGLPYGLDAFEFEFDPNLHVVQAPSDHGGPGQFSAHVIEGTDHCAAMVIRSGLN